MDILSFAPLFLLEKGNAKQKMTIIISVRVMKETITAGIAVESLIEHYNILLPCPTV